MRTPRKQRGFLLNPFRFAGSVQQGALSSVAEASTELRGASVAASLVSVSAGGSVIAASDQEASAALSVAGESSVTAVGAAIAAAAASSAAEASMTANAAGNEVTCDAADFDSGDDIRRQSTMSNTSSTNKGILSLWFKLDDLLEDTDQVLFSAGDFGGNAHLSAYISYFPASGTGFVGELYLALENSSGSQSFNCRTSMTFTDTNQHHLLVSWEGATLNVYVDGVAVALVHSSGPSDVTTDWSAFDRWYVGQNYDFDGEVSSNVDAGVAELYVTHADYLDFDVEENRQKFRSADGKPIDLGATGSTPTGSVPTVYLHLDDGETANNFAINRAGNGNFSVTGALSTHPSSPSD